MLTNCIFPAPRWSTSIPGSRRYFTANSGYAYAFDTVAADLADGEHVLVIWTEDRWGGRTFIGERRFLVDNPQVMGRRRGDVAGLTSPVLERIRHLSPAGPCARPV